MQINARAATGLPRFVGFVVKLAVIVMVVAVALMLGVASATRSRAGVNSQALDFVRGADGTWVHPA